MHVVTDPRSSIYDAELDQESSSTILIETASQEHMPHSVFQFLELVSKGSYDGTLIYRNAKHVLQAGPSSNPDQMERLRQKYPSLTGVAFQEYSPEMPHKKYTLGFPNRPGGPDFYINMLDNTRLHGPYGQMQHYGDVGDADPCFGTVVQGRETIDRICKSDVEQSGFHDNLVHPVTIQKMFVIVDKAAPVL